MSEQRFRFIVSSAEEAVTVLRERIGEHARVISVRQVEGTGLTRFLHAPKLEVIAEKVAAPEETETRISAVPPEESEPAMQVRSSERLLPLIEGDPSLATGSVLSRLLRAGGLSSQTIARLRNRRDWAAVEALAPRQALLRVGAILREQFEARTPRALGDRIAFVGSPGAGTTTALCKWIAGEVFVRQRRGVVLKLDLDRVNPGDALAVFCEALGVPCVRSIPDVPPLGANQSLFIDVPGIVPTSPRAAEELDAALAALFTTARVIVINAAYEVELIKRAFEFAARAGCTHVAFTHLDEVPQWGKLWEFLLASELTPLFLATGPNIAGEIEEHVFDGVLARTFPAPSSASEDARRTESQPRPPVANRQPPQAGRPFRYPGPQAAESLATS